MMDYMFDKKYDDYYNDFSKFDSYKLNRELIKYKIKREEIENERMTINSDYISVVALVISIYSFVMTYLFKINLTDITIKNIFIHTIVFIIIMLLTWMFSEYSHKKNNKKRNKEICKFDLLIQILENLIAEKEKENNKKHIYIEEKIC